MNTVNTELSFIEVWFTVQTSKALEIENNVNLTLIIGQLKTASKRVVQETAKATGDLIGNEISSIGKPKEKEKTKET